MSENLIKQPIVWIDHNEALEQACASWQGKSLLALDTEFMRSRTYYPIPGLIQVNDGEKNYLIDPTAVDDFFPLIEIFDDQGILKILHSCTEDLEVFQHAMGCLPCNILDTQIAAAMVGFDFSIGFGRLVQEALGVELPKNETRSDWLQRPLSQAQTRYAAVDVEYLYALAGQLVDSLKDKDRLVWALEDSNSLTANYFENQDPSKSYQRFRSGWKLGARQLATLQSLSRWREDRAQEKNVPRNRIIKETAMYAIAQQAPSHISQLRNLNGLSERMIRVSGKKILEIVSETQSLPDSQLPDPMPKPLDKGERNILELLKQKVNTIADDLLLPSEILVKKKDYENLVFGLRNGKATLPVGLRGWRQVIVGEPLVEIAKSCLAE